MYYANQWLGICLKQCDFYEKLRLLVGTIKNQLSLCYITSPLHGFFRSIEIKTSKQTTTFSIVYCSAYFVNKLSND
ncbi:unnamed protein product [Caenorhabditis angaria]|uniref:Uncharacterized protein n=1 Tax=Caenorhabditis angaria TaxID=860376 RepID=A0A9P1J108_9PELO|nr:unnamed protein product [Caenorhabditis angaria]